MDVDTSIPLAGSSDHSAGTLIAVVNLCVASVVYDEQLLVQPWVICNPVKHLLATGSLAANQAELSYWVGLPDLIESVE